MDFQLSGSSSDEQSPAKNTIVKNDVEMREENEELSIFQFPLPKPEDIQRKTKQNGQRKGSKKVTNNEQLTLKQMKSFVDQDSNDLPGDVKSAISVLYDHYCRSHPKPPPKVVEQVAKRYYAQSNTFPFNKICYYSCLKIGDKTPKFDWDTKIELDPVALTDMSLYKKSQSSGEFDLLTELKYYQENILSKGCMAVFNFITNLTTKMVEYLATMNNDLRTLILLECEILGKLQPKESQKFFSCKILASLESMVEGLDMKYWSGDVEKAGLDLIEKMKMADILPKNIDWTWAKKRPNFGQPDQNYLYLEIDDEYMKEHIMGKRGHLVVGSILNYPHRGNEYGATIRFFKKNKNQQTKTEVVKKIEAKKNGDAVDTVDSRKKLKKAPKRLKK